MASPARNPHFKASGVVYGAASRMGGRTAGRSHFLGSLRRKAPLKQKSVMTKRISNFAKKMRNSTISIVVVLPPQNRSDCLKSPLNGLKIDFDFPKKLIHKPVRPPPALLYSLDIIMLRDTHVVN